MNIAQIKEAVTELSPEELAERAGWGAHSRHSHARRACRIPSQGSGKGPFRVFHALAALGCVREDLGTDESQERDEASPTLSFHKSRNIWRCFGACGKHGDGIALIMQRKGLDFGV